MIRSLILAGVLATAWGAPVRADVVPSGRTDQQLATPSTSIESETAPGPFEGFLSLGIVADLIQYAEPNETMAMVDDTVYRVRPCLELRVADAVGACVGYSFGTGREDGQWVVDLTLISLAWHGIHLSLGAHLGGPPAGGSGPPASLRLAIPLYAGWLPFKVPKTRVRLVWASGGLGAGVEWGWK